MVKTKEYKDLRPIVAKLHKEGNKPKQIWENLGRTVALCTIYVWIKEFENNGKYGFFSSNLRI